MLENFLWPKLYDLFDEHGAESVWFQQDGATAHTSHCSPGILREMFPGHVASLHGDIGWLLRSPDLTPCDFSLWDYLKAQVYQHRPQILEALKEGITKEGAANWPEMTCWVMANYQERLNQCINNEGHHLNDIIFEKHLFKTALCVLAKVKHLFSILLGLVFISFPNWGVLSAASCTSLQVCSLVH
jgi:hypothetical protein